MINNFYILWQLQLNQPNFNYFEHYTDIWYKMKPNRRIKYLNLLYDRAILRRDRTGKINFSFIL